MRFASPIGVVLLLYVLSVIASPYREDLVDYNLNVNQNAQSPLEYTASRSNTTYTPSPPNWRAIPFYTILTDKFADGDPSNNDYFGTMYEYDWRETQLRSGGDLKGIAARLDYLAGMGVKGVYISGTPFINMLWQADSKCSHEVSKSAYTDNSLGYSPLDFTVLDPHWGTITDWQAFIDEVHARGMYFMMDFTVGTMADLIGFDGYVTFLTLAICATILSPWQIRYLNVTAPFELNEYNAVWKDSRYAPWGFTEYQDFTVSSILTSCKSLDSPT